MIRFICVILFIFLVTFNVDAQWRDIQLDRIGEELGITSRVRDIVQDSIGYIYIATDQGLYKYDGNESKFLGHDPSDATTISEGQLNKLIVGKNNNVWMTLYGSGLNKFDPKTDKFERYPLPDHGLSDLTGGISIAEDHQGNIWVGGHHYLLYKFDPNTATFESYHPSWKAPKETLNRRFDFYSIYPDQKDKNLLWLTVHDEKAPSVDFPTYGIVSFDIQEQVFEKHPAAGNIKHQDKNGHLWSAIWADMITEYDPHSKKCTFHSYRHLYPSKRNLKVEHGHVSIDLIPSGNDLLISAYGILIKKPGQKVDLLAESGSNLETTAIFEDNQKNIWLGRGEGLSVYSPKSNLIDFYSLSECGIESRVYPGKLIYQPMENMIYFMAHSAGIRNRVYKISPVKGNRLKAEEMPTGARASAIALDKNHKIHFQTEQNKLPYADIMAGNEAGWIVGINQVEIFWVHVNQSDIRKVNVRDFSDQTTGSLGYFQFISENEIVFHSRHEIFKMNLMSGMVERLDIPFNNQGGKIFIRDIFYESGGAIWVCTPSALRQFNSIQSKWVHSKTYSAKEGITTPTLQKLHQDHSGRIWAFSNNGVDVIQPVTHEVRNFNTKDGFPSSVLDPWQVINLPDDRMTMSAGNGLVIFHPDSLWHSKDVQNISIDIQNIRVNGQSISLQQNERGSTYRLSKGPKVVDVQFQGLAFPNDRNMTYQYRTSKSKEELEKAGWIDLRKNNQLVISDLAYGNTIYQLKVGGAQNLTSVKEFTLNNPTPLTAQWWFPFLMIGAVVFGGYLYYRNRIAQIKKAESEKTRINQKMSALELTALRSQMNPHFMFNSLNSIKSYILEAKPDVAADYLSQFSHLIRRILHNSSEQTIPLTEEIETLKLYLSLEKFRFENAFDFSVEVCDKLDISEMMIPPMLLQPYVENAIWHGLMHQKEAGHLSIKFKRNGQYLVCAIDDNGIGREKANELKSLSARKHKSMGMGITANRIQLLNNLTKMGIEIKVIDKKDDDGIALGTRVVLTMPLAGV